MRIVHRNFKLFLAVITSEENLDRSIQSGVESVSGYVQRKGGKGARKK